MVSVEFTDVSSDSLSMSLRPSERCVEDFHGLRVCDRHGVAVANEGLDLD